MMPRVCETGTRRALAESTWHLRLSWYSGGPFSRSSERTRHLPACRVVIGSPSLPALSNYLDAFVIAPEVVCASVLGSNLKDRCPVVTLLLDGDVHVAVWVDPAVFIV